MKRFDLIPDEESGRLEYRLLILNQLYIRTKLGHSDDSKESIPCAFCCSNRPINSHVWPNTLLKSFKRIHGNDTSGEFHLSIDNDANPNFEIIGRDNIAIHMLCKGCDARTSNEENMLSQHYSFFSAYPHNPLEFKNSKSWFQRILAVIMVKGILMNCNLLRIRNRPCII